MVTIKLFAVLKEKAGKSELTVSFPGGTAGDLMKQVGRDYPLLADILSCGTVMVSVNHEFVKPDALIRDGDEVAFMPPFSGGAPGGTVRVQTGPFSLEQEIAILKRSSSSIGAVVTFLGTTRDVSRGKQVAKLEFEHYPGMAEKKLTEIRARAMKDFGVIDITIVHRVGELPVGEEIVLIVVVSGHRAEAFEACRFCIDELKRITPIWKKETTPEGDVWVEEHP